ncbi:hypothetical protein MEA186_22526 [Mesorhizobium amorphae CCNWGS0123]|uniref:Uncharacterized protein n=1 Tax=Mesorhizobium amorphae CCNWGS0123 TaxID=1082933 RepID=G6YEW0_9HYPH|nr:hypothetical protein MEA186_22526 [Mesorhizobium amorphae CCNWGS0123]
MLNRQLRPKAQAAEIKRISLKTGRKLPAGL